MGLVAAKLQETAEHVIAMSILVLNLRRALSAPLLLLYWFTNQLCHYDEAHEKNLLVQ